jgi:dihydrofolate reductase
MFESYWPQVAKDPNAPKEMRIIADELTEMTKVVFTKTLDAVNWKNTRLVKDDIIQVVQKLKQGEGADIAIFGSGTIVQQLANARLVDEYLMVVTPVVLGKGKPQFKDVKKFEFELLGARNFKSGHVMVHYRLKAGKRGPE